MNTALRKSSATVTELTATNSKLNNFLKSTPLMEKISSYNSLLLLESINYPDIGSIIKTSLEHNDLTEQPSLLALILQNSSAERDITQQIKKDSEWVSTILNEYATGKRHWRDNFEQRVCGIYFLSVLQDDDESLPDSKTHRLLQRTFLDIQTGTFHGNEASIFLQTFAQALQKNPYLSFQWGVEIRRCLSQLNVNNFDLESQAFLLMAKSTMELPISSDLHTFLNMPQFLLIEEKIKYGDLSESEIISYAGKLYFQK